MEVVGIIATALIGIICGGFIGASIGHIASYRKEDSTESFGQVFSKMIQPVLFFLLIYGITYFIRGWSGLLIGAVAGVIPFIINYRTTVRQQHAKYRDPSKIDKELG